MEIFFLHIESLTLFDVFLESKYIFLIMSYLEILKSHV